MILFENSIIKLDYTPATDILEVAYPDLEGFFLFEIKHSINILVDNVRNYDVKRVLLDASKTVISVSEKESREIATYLAAGLMKSRVEKVARIQSASAKVETTAQGNMEHLQSSLLLPFQLRNFTTKPEAFGWLMDNR